MNVSMFRQETNNGVSYIYTLKYQELEKTHGITNCTSVVYMP